MTPVEERIDHEEAKRFSATVLDPRTLRDSHDAEPVRNLARAYLDLLTERSAREERLRRISDPSYVGNYSAEEVVAIYRKWASDALSLPATEPAQPEFPPCDCRANDWEEGDNNTIRCAQCGGYAGQPGTSIQLTAAQPEEEPSDDGPPGPRPGSRWTRRQKPRYRHG